MSEPEPAAAAISVVGLVIRGFAQKLVVEQTRLKAQLEAVVAVGLQNLAPAERIVFDAPEGMVIAILAAPEQAVEVAERCQAAAADLPLCIGVNQGPVKMMDEQSASFVGDGILGAITLANLATRGPYLVSRSFQEALRNSAPGRASEFSSVGAFTDSTVRTHEFYAHDPRAASARRRRLMGYSVAVVILGVGFGIALRAVIGEPKQPAQIHFAVTPRGEIFVNGEPKGTTPPIKTLTVAAGAHVIEVRNNPHPPLRLEVALSPKQEISVTHSFGGARRDKKESFVDTVRRNLGI